MPSACTLQADILCSVASKSQESRERLLRLEVRCPEALPEPPEDFCPRAFTQTPLRFHTGLPRLQDLKVFAGGNCHAQQPGWNLSETGSSTCEL